ncbi:MULTISPECIES: NAD-dependent succinate-semialdehyde dehydrogenase [unclassified Mesorhizobium]|uniref:NAD-dependent succinate-semialdehyde dehydrogenase n=1 Tax=unclassified Mesorhizobium TaxID=325217 RepID=UPI001092A0B8|nr:MULTISPECIES: NAD-dependent succinate-semialdehyde dehydrogenase [unclassified Mesorhizobium]TGS43764.1 NAD-dependent succinate-semialdehyde dehydrogenase [Mesorhizobium sp. M8A.F.Ca.ET.182.01.1.1]TGS78345.1 NAD-dependent succinate-semialdehyde dehydrogenase [Mesorhizobium sp. M8A.F.Ca.ET.181.01.1.1]TGV15483.1 NAD-dependent succinate-semialdehyde dehydrogenase [Mesorhizobium sp. M8A.F.Ca.ET.173.01.1.1]
MLNTLAPQETNWRLNRIELLRQCALVAGDWVESNTRTAARVFDPATGDLVGMVPQLSRADTRNAIEVAARVGQTWSRESPLARADVLQRWRSLILDNLDDLSQIMTAECGKPLAESRGEITFAADFVRWFAEEARRTYGEMIPSSNTRRRLAVIKEPVGVCAAITPWNFPGGTVLRKLAPALAAGCSMVLKPAPQTPFTSLALCYLGMEAGLPAGVLSCLTGDEREIGAELTENPLVRKITFTGSTSIGRLLLAQCAPTVKRVSLELGGNAPLIVFDDADLELAVQGTLASKFRNNGQTCVSPNRIYVASSVYETFSDLLVRAVEKLKVGDGRDASTMLGPLVNAAAVSKIERQIADAVDLGATVLTGGKRHGLGGNFFEPTVLADAAHGMALASEETFGPVAPLFRFDTEDEVVELANRTQYGLASYFYSKDISRCWRMISALDFGIVGANESLTSAVEAPFGGRKQSGLGRESGRLGIDEYLDAKYVSFGGL